ncbi:MAG: LptF/LptG family permease [Treponema sp.]|nr:LptF/LptG family permease [Candidatus Treponema caballi]
MTLVSYLLKKFIPAFLLTMLFFAFIIDLADILINLWNYIQNQVPVSQILKVMVLYFPKSLWYAAPLSVLFAVSFTLSGLYADSEMTAIFASGISLFKFSIPLLVISVILSFGFFYFENTYVVPCYKQKVELQNSLLGKDQSKNNDDVVVISEGGSIVYKALFFNDNEKRIYSLTVVVEEDNALKEIILADSASWSEEKERWELLNGIVYRYDGSSFSVDECTESDLNLLTELPETFQNSEISVDEVNVDDARKYIELLNRTGLPSGEAESVYYKKYAFPSIIVLVVLLSIGLTGRSKRNVMLVSLILCVCAAVLFYVTQMVTMYMAKFEYLSAFAGAWLPVIVFFIISIILLKFTRT